MVSIAKYGTLRANEIDEIGPTDGLICAPSPFNLPEWPDAVAGTVYENHNFTAADGWSAVRCTLSYSNGKMIVTATDANPQIYRAIAVALGKTVRIKIRKLAGAATTCLISSSSAVVYQFSKTFVNNEAINDCYMPADAGGNLGIYVGNTGSAAGDVYEITFIYIGNGTYTSLALDGSGNGNHATVVGATPVDTPAGRGWSFDKLNDSLRFDITKNNYTGAFSVSRFVQGKARTSVQYIASRHAASGNRGWTFYINASNRLEAILSGDGTAYISITADAGTEITADSQVGFMFVPSVGIYLIKNGVVIKSNVTSVPASVFYSASQIAVDGASYGYAEVFDGWIADPRIYNRALSAEEVSILYKLHSL